MSWQTVALKKAVEKGYKVNKEGDVFSFLGVKLCPWRGNRGYLSFMVFTDRPGRARERVPVHRFVAYCKYGDKLFEEGIEVRHLNGNPLDNSWDNIAIGTSSENALDKPTATRKRIAKIAARKTRKLSDEQVVQLREDRRNGAKYSELMEKYQVAKATVSYIVNGKTYK